MFKIKFLLKVSIFDELNWKLPKLKVAKIESCQIWMLPIESDLCISRHKLTVLMNWIESYQNWKLPKIKVAKIESCKNWKLPIESCQIWKLPILKVAKVENEFSSSC